MSLQGKVPQITRSIALMLWLIASCANAQINTNSVMVMGRNALYYDDYVVAIGRFNMVISAKPYLAEPYFYRGLAKFYLEDFTGAEADCTNAIERNRYVANPYTLRGLCRIRQQRFEEAAADYERVILLEPANKSAWHNLVLCRIEDKKLEQADAALDSMVHQWPKEAEYYCIRAQVDIMREDTTEAIAQLDRALEINAYEAAAWRLKAMISLARDEWADGEACLTKAIVQMPRETGLLINRALARYHQDNLRGAMDDYDHAIEIDSVNYLAHYNRALLRAQVGDDNRAIQDFNFVLSKEPDNMLALYNRALLLDNTGDYRGALRDISTVIDSFPQFWAGYHERAAIKRKIGDVAGAERDEFRVMKATLDARYGDQAARDATHSTRKQSQKNIDDYAKLVEADEQETENEYSSEWRGRVQNRATDNTPLPPFIMSYYLRENATVPHNNYCAALEAYNRRSPAAKLFLVPHEEEAAALELQCAQDALQNMTDSTGVLGKMLMAQERLCIKKDNNGFAAQLTMRAAADLYAEAAEADAMLAVAQYNRGCVLLMMSLPKQAEEAFTKALSIDGKFPQAYYNRGLCHLQAGHIEDALADLSQAGELGLYQAYNLIKQNAKK